MDDEEDGLDCFRSMDIQMGSSFSFLCLFDGGSLRRIF